MILKTSNKMVFEMVLQMVFVPNLCTVSIALFVEILPIGVTGFFIKI